jgi:hypothetical protein
MRAAIQERIWCVGVLTDYSARQHAIPLANRVRWSDRMVSNARVETRGSVFPKWQVSSTGSLLPELPRIFEIRGGDS